LGTLDDRVAIVTGGTRGIGRAYCLGLAREGCRIAVADVTDPSSVVEEITAHGGQAMPVRVDVSEEASTAAMACVVNEHFGRIDILVNNAAYYTAMQNAPFDELGVSEWDRAFAVNVRGPWLCAKAVTPFMRARGYGRIINISSMTVHDGTPNLLHYVAAKAAVIGLTRGLARELGDAGIAVNTVTPDYIPHDRAYAARQPEWLEDWIVNRRCFKRGEAPEDMVGVIIFLAGPGSDFITGQNIAVNGGSAFF
jgi:3-oxoacyl-[acyl-carrier protein] reductase